MIAKWKTHCPYNHEEKPAHLQAWRKGWFYRKDHGLVNPPKEIKLKMIKQGVFSSWLEGYFAADKHLLEAKPGVRQ